MPHEHSLRKWLRLFVLLISMSSCQGIALAAASSDTEKKWLFYEVRKEEKLLAYVFGVVHYPVGEKQLPAKVYAALEKSSAVHFELNFFDPEQAATSNQMLTTNAKGAALPEILLPETIATLEGLYDHYQLPAENRRVVDRWTPYMAILALSGRCEQTRSSGPVPERAIYEYAKLSKIPLGASLEDAQEQLKWLSALSPEQWNRYVQAYAPWLKDPHCGDKVALSLGKVRDRMLLGDADGAQSEYMRFYSEVVPVQWFQTDYFLTARNGPMADKIARLAESGGPHFFAVGAVHLGGERGVLRQLREKGYQLIQR